MDCFSISFDRILWSWVLQEGIFCLREYDVQLFCFVMSNMNGHDRKLYESKRRVNRRYWSMGGAAREEKRLSLYASSLPSNFVEALLTWKNSAFTKHSVWCTGLPSTSTCEDSTATLYCPVYQVAYQANLDGCTVKLHALLQKKGTWDVLYDIHTHL